MTPAGTSNEFDVQNKWEENTQHHTYFHENMSVGTSGEYKLLLLPTPDEGATPRGWLVSEVLRATGGRHTGPETVSNFPRLLRRLETRFRKQSGKRGAWRLLLLTAPPVVRLERAGV